MPVHVFTQSVELTGKLGFFNLDTEYLERVLFLLQEDYDPYIQLFEDVF